MGRRSYSRSRREELNSAYTNVCVGFGGLATTVAWFFGSSLSGAIGLGVVLYSFCRACRSLLREGFGLNMRGFRQDKTKRKAELIGGPYDGHIVDIVGLPGRVKAPSGHTYKRRQLLVGFPIKNSKNVYRYNLEIKYGQKTGNK